MDKRLFLTNSASSLAHLYTLNGRSKTYNLSGHKFVSDGQNVAVFSEFLLHHLVKESSLRSFIKAHDTMSGTNYLNSTRFDSASGRRYRPEIFTKLTLNFKTWVTDLAFMEKVIQDIHNFIHRYGHDDMIDVFVRKLFRQYLRNICEIKQTEVAMCLRAWPGSPGYNKPVKLTGKKPFIGDLNDFDPDDPFDPEESETEMAMKTGVLYKHTTTDGQELFCSYLATDSTGRIVIEVKGTGTVISVAADTLEEVVPYTVSIFWIAAQGADSYIVANKDVLKTGMMITHPTYGIGIVKTINTRSGTKTNLDLKQLSLVLTEPLVKDDPIETDKVAGGTVA